MNTRNKILTLYSPHWLSWTFGIALQDKVLNQTIIMILSTGLQHYDLSHSMIRRTLYIIHKQSKNCGKINQITSKVQFDNLHCSLIHTYFGSWGWTNIWSWSCYWLVWCFIEKNWKNLLLLDFFSHMNSPLQFLAHFTSSLYYVCFDCDISCQSIEEISMKVRKNE